MKKAAVMMVAAMVAAAFTVQAETAPAAAPAAPAAPAVPAAKAPAAPVVKPAVPAVALELTGKVIQEEKTIKNKKDGTETKQMVIMLDMAADGIKVALPKAKKGGADPATFVGKDVKVSGKGTSAVDKNGKKVIRIQSIDKIDPVTP